MNAQKANNTTEKVQQLQRKLYLVAKENSKQSLLNKRMLKVKNVGKPDEGKPHVRFDEEGQVTPALYSISWMKNGGRERKEHLIASRKTMDGEDPLKTLDE